MVRKNRTPEEIERRAKIRELLQVSNVSSMVGIQNLYSWHLRRGDLGYHRQPDHRQDPAHRKRMAATATGGRLRGGVSGRDPRSCSQRRPNREESCLHCHRH